MMIKKLINGIKIAATINRFFNDLSEMIFVTSDFSETALAATVFYEGFS